MTAGQVVAPELGQLREHAGRLSHVERELLTRAAELRAAVGFVSGVDANVQSAMSSALYKLEGAATSAGTVARKVNAWANEIVACDGRLRTGNQPTVRPLPGVPMVPTWITDALKRLGYGLMGAEAAAWWRAYKNRRVVPTQSRPPKGSRLEPGSARDKNFKANRAKRTARSRWIKLGKGVGRASGVLNVGLAGMEQWDADAKRAGEMSLGERRDRAVTRAVIEGGLTTLGTWGGGLLGGAGGLAVGGPPGAVVGGIAGGIAGGLGGNWVGDAIADEAVDVVSKVHDINDEVSERAEKVGKKARTAVKDFFSW